MKINYFNSYLKTYFWQIISIVLNLVSMVVVVPMLTSEPSIYGIYAICVSFAIYLNYADLGFISACYKYAGERYIQNKYNEEIKFYGFASFVILIFVSIISVFFIYFSFYPQLLIKDIGSESNIDIASDILLIQAIFSFSIVLQRFVYGVLSVRIKQFVFDRINILGSLLKIISIFYFFGGLKYDIVGYFLFSKIIELLVIITGLVIISNKHSISVLSFFKAFKFDKSIFDITKKLAFSSLFGVIMWILYYEIDLIVIGKLLGPLEASYFAVSLIAIKFFRTFSSVIFSPFQHTYNHYVGLKDFVNLKKTVIQAINLSMPLIVLSALTVILFSNEIIFAWVGKEYLNSSFLLLVLTFNFMFSCIIIPSSNLLLVMEEIKKIYIINAAIVIIFWLGVYLFIEKWGLNSFVIFKTLAGFVSLIFYTKYLLTFLKMNLRTFLNTTLFKLLPTILFLISCKVIFNKLNFGYNISLIKLIPTILIILLLSFLILFFTSEFYKSQITLTLKKIKLWRY